MRKSWYECRKCGYAIDWFDMAKTGTKNGEVVYSMSYCLDCYRIKNAKRMKELYKHSKKIRDWRKEYAKREYVREYHRKYRKENPRILTTIELRILRKRYLSKPENVLKVRARNSVYNSIVSGKLKKAPCEVCGEIKVHAHHKDYSRPLDITWLCLKHHGIIHRRKDLQNIL